MSSAAVWSSLQQPSSEPPTTGQADYNKGCSKKHSLLKKNVTLYPLFQESDEQ